MQSIIDRYIDEIIRDVHEHYRISCGDITHGIQDSIDEAALNLGDTLCKWTNQLLEG